MKHMVLVIYKTVVGPLLAQRGGENAERIVNQHRPLPLVRQICGGRAKISLRTGRDRSDNI